MALAAMAALTWGWQCGGACDLRRTNPSSSSGRLRWRIIVASKRFKRMKKYEADSAGYTTPVLPFLDEYSSSGSRSSPETILTPSATPVTKLASPTSLVSGQEFSLLEFLKSRADKQEEAIIQTAKASEIHVKNVVSDSDEQSSESDTDEKCVQVWRGDKMEVWREGEEKEADESQTEEASTDGSDAEVDQLQSSGAGSGSKRGVPAVMRCFDRAKIYVKAGDGGDGEVAFRREKFVPFGGPSGGKGGRGGNIYLEADPSLNSLLTFRKCVHFRAGNGGRGLGKSQDGATGDDLVVRVPPGTLVRKGGKLLLELTKPGERQILLPGGRNGRGNESFKTANHRTPQLAEKGEQGAEMWVELELKLVADVGIIGVPNAGKSTLLSAISAARPAIAAYPFTTLLPNLGVVSLDFDKSMVVADLPGLLEGAHAGYGLGHEFLRHTERCRVLIHVVDGTSTQPELEYEAVRLELQLFNPRLSSKASIVAFNKMDVPEAAERWPSFQRALESQGVKVCCMSAATTQGTADIVHATYELLKSSSNSYTEDQQIPGDVAEAVKKERSAPINEFQVSVDPDGEMWRIQGAGLERFTQMTNWEYYESFQRFERVLEYSGVKAELKKRGIHEGDRVTIGEMSFTWQDSNHIGAGWKRNHKGSKHWPH